MGGGRGVWFIENLTLCLLSLFFLAFLPKLRYLRYSAARGAIGPGPTPCMQLLEVLRRTPTIKDESGVGGETHDADRERAMTVTIIIIMIMMIRLGSVRHTEFRIAAISRWQENSFCTYGIYLLRFCLPYPLLVARCIARGPACM